MGYETSYRIRLYVKDKQAYGGFRMIEPNAGEKIINEILDISGCDEEDIILNEFGEECLWSDWEKEVKTISRNYPGIYFEIEGEGEDPDDKWKSIIYNGEALVGWYLEYTVPTIGQLLGEDHTEPVAYRSDQTVGPTKKII